MPTSCLTRLHLQFAILLVNANEKWIDQKSIDLLMFEVYKYLYDLPPDITNTIFKLRQNTYNLRNFHLFKWCR